MLAYIKKITLKHMQEHLIDFGQRHMLAAGINRTVQTS